MKPRIVYRIEHKDGNGVFQSETKCGNDRIEKLSKTNCNSIKDRHASFPTPREENLNIRKNDLDWYCAFKSQNMLNIWFTNKELKALTKIGFKIYKLEVREYQIGEYQILFTKESITSKEDITQEILGTSTNTQN